MTEYSDELIASISELWESLVQNGILDKDEVVTGIEIIDIATNHINTFGRFGD
jgi:hypothetical protein